MLHLNVLFCASFSLSLSLDYFGNLSHPFSTFLSQSWGSPSFRLFSFIASLIASLNPSLILACFSFTQALSFLWHWHWLFSLFLPLTFSAPLSLFIFLSAPLSLSLSLSLSNDANLSHRKRLRNGKKFGVSRFSEKAEDREKAATETFSVAEEKFRKSCSSSFLTSCRCR